MSDSSEKTQHNISIEQTKAFVKEAFGNKADQSGNLKYQHSFAVCNLLPERVSLDVRLAALLHDVVEDTEVTIEGLYDMGYSKLTCDIVELLTHDKEAVPYFHYVKNVIEQGLFSSEEMRGAVLVKYADICHNTSPRRNSRELPEELADYYASKHRVPKQMLRTAVLALRYEDFDPWRDTRDNGRGR